LFSFSLLNYAFQPALLSAFPVLPLRAAVGAQRSMGTSLTSSPSQCTCHCSILVLPRETVSGKVSLTSSQCVGHATVSSRRGWGMLNLQKILAYKINKLLLCLVWGGGV